MKRLTIAVLALALMLVPATALAKRGHRVHRSHGNVGTVTSFDSATGELVVTTAKGRALSALVTDDTRIQCPHDDDSAARSSRHGDDDDDDGTHEEPGDDHGDDEDEDEDEDSEDSEDSEHGEHGDDDRRSCSEDDLTAGRVVRRARIDLDGDDAVWTKLKLAKASR